MYLTICASEFWKEQMIPCIKMCCILILIMQDLCKGICAEINEEIFLWVANLQPIFCDLHNFERAAEDTALPQALKHSTTKALTTKNTFSSCQHFTFAQACFLI